MTRLARSSVSRPEEEQLAAVQATAALAAGFLLALVCRQCRTSRYRLGIFDTVRPSMYGAKTYGDLCNDRQTLGFVRLSRIIGAVAYELRKQALSLDYVAALSTYAASVLVRRMRRSTRGVTVQPHRHPTSNRVQTTICSAMKRPSPSHTTISNGLGSRPGGGPRADKVTPGAAQPDIALTGLSRPDSSGTATACLCGRSIDAVVTDPPYDDMIDYTDASDLFYVWLKRALVETHPDFGLSADPDGVQEKSEEIIVKQGGGSGMITARYSATTACSRAPWPKPAAWCVTTVW